MSMDQLERALNAMTDEDWGWWPFLWLRPRKHVDLGLARLAAIAILQGLPCGAVASLALVLARSGARSAAPWVVAAFPLLLFFLGSVLVGPMWNRRAARLRRAIR